MARLQFDFKILVSILTLWGCCILGIQAQLANSAWPSLKNGIKNTGLSDYSGVIADTIQDSIRWRKDIKMYALPDGCLGPNGTQGILWKNIVQADDGTIYVGFGSMCYLYAFSSDGEVKWKKEPGPSYKSAPAIGKDGTIYYGGEDLHAVNPDGTVKWTYEKTLPQDWFHELTVGPEGIIYASSDAGLFAIDTGGTLQWVKTKIKGRNKPAISEDSTLYVSSDSTLHALTFQGEQIWKFMDSGTMNKPSIGKNGTIYVFSENKLHAIDPDGKRKWNQEFDKEITSAQSIGPNGNIYVGVDKTLHAISKEGVLKHTFRRVDRINGLTIDKDGNIYLGTTKVLYALDSDLEVMWKFSRKGIDDNGQWNTPIIGRNGTVYAGHVEFYALGGRKVTDIKKNRHIPKQFRLKQNYPNPFNLETRISFVLPRSGYITLEVYNSLGKRIDVMVDRKMKAGEHTVTFNGARLSSGIYLYRLRTGSFSESKKMLLIK